MKREVLNALLTLADIQAEAGIYETLNGYTKDRTDPWYLVMTKWGPIHIGWRKRVLAIDWTGTQVRTIVTTEDVTKDETMVHAWSLGKAVDYLSAWRRAAQDTPAMFLAPTLGGPRA